MKNLQISSKIKLLLVVIFTLILSACGDANPLVSTEGYGFWAGLWDGWTAVFAFIGSLFGGDFNIYEVNNNGNWYNFGFLIGIGFVFVSGAKASS